MNIGLVEFSKTRKIEDMIVEGTFDPEGDIHSPVPEEELVHFSIKGIPNWGVSYSRSLDPPLPQFLGYFHDHGDERVYIQPTLGGMFWDAYGGLIPCLECNTGIKLEYK